MVESPKGKADRMAVVPLEQVAQVILVIGRQKVILDADLARLYGVKTRRLNQQVRRNPQRIPPISSLS